MNIVSSFKERAPKIAISIALLLAVIAPAVVVTHVFAAQVTERSIALSSSSASAKAVTYAAEFTTPSDASGGFVIDFCTSPDPSEACTAPTGLVASGVSTATTGYAIASAAANQVVVTHAITNNDKISVSLANIDNPTQAGAIYARVSTFNTGSQATAIDQGSVAISITNTIGVSGSVLESLTFCVASKTIALNCSDASTNLPTLKLGETNGDVVALTPSAVSTGVLYTQISTNAASGAVVNLKSATDCGGLKRAGAAACDITPALADGVTAGQAKFGLKTGTAAGTAGYAKASGTIKSHGSYNDSTYTYNYVNTNATGVTSAIGDPILDTDGKPADNQNMPITFGVSVSNSTPAGNYSTSLTMIATGKF
jgi:hypothetical protein